MMDKMERLKEILDKFDKKFIVRLLKNADNHPYIYAYADALWDSGYITSFDDYEMLGVYFETLPKMYINALKRRYGIQ